MVAHEIDWLLLAFVPWTATSHHRCHHLTRELVAAGDRVLWVDPPDPLRPSGAAAADEVAPGVWRSPSPGMSGLSPLGQQAWARGLADVVARWRTPGGRLVTLAEAPEMHFAATAVPTDLLVWDALDDWRHALGGGGVRMEVAQRALARRAELVLAVSEPVAMRARQLGARRVELLPNGCRPEDWADVDALEPLPEVASAPRPRLVYTGGIDEGIDVEALHATAAALPGASFLFAGQVLVPAVGAALERVPGMRLLGHRPYAELPHLLSGADGCLLPFRLTPFNVARDSIKLYEYLASGRPVVSSATPQARRHADVIVIAEDAPGFGRACARALTTGDVTARRREAAANAWCRRADRLRSLALEPGRA